MTGDGTAAAWAPVAREGESIDDLPLKEWVGQALGAASSCWDNLPGAGEFQSTRCAQIYDALMAKIDDAQDPG